MNELEREIELCKYFEQWVHFGTGLQGHLVLRLQKE